jgi:putative ABC transport system permease protein
LGGSLLLGLVCAVIPAIQAYRTDISKVLAGN